MYPSVVNIVVRVFVKNFGNLFINLFILGFIVIQGTKLSSRVQGKCCVEFRVSMHVHLKNPLT